MGRCMVAAPGIIPTRSKTQAEEWSLVLLSQGIESVIERDEEGGRGWGVQVDPAQFSTSVRILRQYISENKTVPREQEQTRRLIFDWGNSWFFVLLVVMFVLNATRAAGLREFGVMDRASFLAGEWWRPFTAILLHNDAAHLIANVVIGAIFLALAGGIFGTMRAFCLSFAGGVIANVTKCFLYANPPPSLGASGMVMAAVGLLTASAMIDREVQDSRQSALRGCAAGTLLLVLLGFDPHPQTDVLAHVIGFFAGFWLGAASLLVGGRFARKAERA